LCLSNDETQSRDNDLKVKRKEKIDEREKYEKIKQYAFYVGLALFFIIIIYMKMKEETFRRYSMSAGKDIIDQDPYKVMGLTYSTPQEDVKKKYKALAQELHPDKNPDCDDCKEKFERLAKAYEILGNEESRKFFDTTSNAKNTIKSTTMSLNVNKWKTMVENSDDIWMIMIYIDDSSCETFTNFWDEVASNFPFIRFGRVNAAFQTDLLPL